MSNKTPAGHGRAPSVPDLFYIGAAVITVQAIVESDGKHEDVPEKILNSCGDILESAERTVFGILAFHYGAFQSHGPGKPGDIDPSGFDELKDLIVASPNGKGKAQWESA